MDRRSMLGRLEPERTWDAIIVGGGATGLGCAVDAASRGLRTLLLEQHDFAKGTSGRSTKLVHGGVRYLQQGNVALVREALRERGRMVRSAPHLVSDLRFVVPRYAWWEGPFYGIGLKLYDLLAGKLNLGPSRTLSPEETLALIPNLEDDGLQGGVQYHDGQFDDARMAVTLMQTAADHGACLLNYARVTELHKTAAGLIDGVTFEDAISGEREQVRGRVVINATGPFSDAVRRMDEPGVRGIMQASQGVHIVLDPSFLQGETAIMVPHTDDGRVLFAVPWHGRVLVGTTDTPLPRATLDPRPTADEIGFILRNANRYLDHDPTESDVLSCFAGIRPLVAPGGADDTASVSRKHEIIVAPSGLVTIAGGKWTTYRQMAQDTIDEAIGIGNLPDNRCVTEGLHLRGWMARDDPAMPSEGHLRVYGRDAAGVRALAAEDPALAEPLHPKLPYLRAQVVWAVREELACTVEDVLERRTRALILDARAARDAAPEVARLMAAELGESEAWQRAQVEAFETYAARYLPPAASGAADEH